MEILPIPEVLAKQPIFKIQDILQQITSRKIFYNILGFSNIVWRKYQTGINALFSTGTYQRSVSMFDQMTLCEKS